MRALVLTLALVAVLCLAAVGAFLKGGQAQAGKKPPHWYQPTSGHVAVAKKPPHWF